MGGWRWAAGDKPPPYRTAARLPISGGEWRWLVGVTLGILLATLIPPTVGRLLGPADRVHVGVYWHAEDFSQYLATMQEAATTRSWLTHDHFSAEPHDPVLMYPLYVAIGKLAAITSLPLMAVYAAVELLMRLVVPASLYIFVAEFVPNVGSRRFAFALAIFATGVALWVVLAGWALGVSPGPTLGQERLYAFAVETVTLSVFLAAPHLGLGLAATLMAIVCFRGASEGSFLWLVLLGVDVLALALLHPFNLPVLLASFSVYACVDTLMKHRLSTWLLAACVVAVAAGGPLLVYNFVTFNFVPFWSETYGAQNHLPSPRPTELLVHYGVLLPLAALGVLAVRPLWRSPSRVLLVWLAVGGLAMYAPVPYQRRFAVGLQPVLAVLATIGWPAVERVALALVGRFRISETGRAALARRLTVYPLLFLAVPGALVNYFSAIGSAAFNEPVPIYLVDRDTYALGQWIAQRSGPDDGVLGSFVVGNVFAGVVSGHVVLGHEIGTLHALEKGAKVTALYRGELTREELETFLAGNRVSFLIVGPEERKVGSYDPGLALGLPVAMRIGEAVAYAVPKSQRSG